MDVVGYGSYGELHIDDIGRVLKPINYTEYQTPQGDKRRVISTSSLREIAFMNMLNHPNICKLTDVDDKNVIMPYVGIPLSDYAQGGLSDIEALPVIQQTLLGLTYMHDHGIVHCDIKPNNIMIDGNDHITVCDFNSSSLDGGESSSDICMWYRSLETMIGQWDTSADVWALGCTIYEIYSGSNLFGRFDNTEDVIQEIISRVRFSDDQLNLYGVQHRSEFRGLERPTKMRPDIFTVIQSMIQSDPNLRPSMRMVYFSLYGVEIPKYGLSNRLGQYNLINRLVLERKISKNTGMISTQLLERLSSEHGFGDTDVFQWCVAVIVSMLSSKPLNFYGAPKRIRKQVIGIDYGVMLQDVLHICNYQLI